MTARDIGTELLRSLIAVVEERSYTKAAKRLGVSQPTVSAHIRRLRVQLGYDIFDKRVPGVALTPRGETALAQARQILSSYQQMLDMRGHAESAERIIRVGVADETPKLASIMAAIRKTDPAVIFTVERGRSQQMSERLAAGDIDIGLIFDTRRRHDDAVVSGRETFVWSGLALEDAPTDPVNLVAPPDDCLSHEIMMAALSEHDINYRIAVRAASYAGAINAAAAGLGYLPALRMNIPSSLSEIGPERGLPPLTTSFFWSVHVGRRMRMPAAKQFAELLAREMDRGSAAMVASLDCG